MEVSDAVFFSPSFSSGVTFYSVAIPTSAYNLAINARAVVSGATISIKINGDEVQSGSTYVAMSTWLNQSFNFSPMTVTITVTALNKINSKAYTLKISKMDYLKTLQNLADGQVGSSVALSQDGNTMVVGAPGEYGFSGAVYVIGRSGLDWVQKYRLITGSGSYAQCGSSVAISEDASTIVVGCPGKSGGRGAAYVFTWTGYGWSRYRLPTPTDNLPIGNNANFGNSVAIGSSWALSGAWVQTIVVGAPMEVDTTVGKRGAVYVYDRIAGGPWFGPAVLRATTKERGDQYHEEFGISVAISGETIVVGAPDSMNSDSYVEDGGGGVFVFDRISEGMSSEPSKWAQPRYPLRTYLDSGDEFGYSVAISGDLLVVGAPGEDSNSTGVNGIDYNNDAQDSGAAYVFFRNGSSWQQEEEVYLKASNSRAEDRFGEVVAISGETILIGAPDKDNASGAAYIFECGEPGCFQQAYLKATNSEAYDGFGVSVAIAGNTAVVGAPWEDGANNLVRQAGVVYGFR